MNWQIDKFTDVPNYKARFDFIEYVATKGSPTVPIHPSALRVIDRYASVAVLMNGFYSKLHGGERAAWFPTNEAKMVCAKAG